MADLLANDIRVLFYLTALLLGPENGGPLLRGLLLEPRLRELACKPLQSPFLRLTRSTAFFDILESSVWAPVLLFGARGREGRCSL